jgi:hypothetical protein
MGRYYSGDIEGKFWFGVQSSDSADRFGVTGIEPSYIEYHFFDEDLEGVEKELKNIEDQLGDNLAKIKKFFEDNNGYNSQTLLDAGINESLLSTYADYLLGCQIRECVVEHGQCSFTAEL